MKFETLKKDYRKPILIITGVVVAIVATVFFVGTRAKYRYTASIQAAKGTINYDEPDLWITALYIQQEDGSYKSSESVPTSGYALNETQTYCGYSNDNGLIKDDRVKVTYENGNIKISDITKVGTKCHIYFKKDKCSGGVACKTILAKNTLDTSRISGEFTSTFEEETTGKIFEGPADDYGETTYIFAGKDPNNWVQFANKWWRIIRINGDGSVRLIYAGADTTADPPTTGEVTQIQTSAFNSSYNDNAYVGYMYGATGQSGDNGYTSTHTNTNNSTIKGILDTWYDNNIGNNEAYLNKIETKVGFCGDRSLNTTSETWWNSDTKNGYGTQATAYGAYGRVRSYNGSSNVWRTTQTATLKCKQTNDLYTATTASKGNKALDYPVGLITMDEVLFVGGFGGANNTSYWLYTNQNYWTMSPYNVNTLGNAYVFIVYSNGNLYHINGVGTAYGVRPVINIKADTQLTGSGTTSIPFVVSG